MESQPNRAPVIAIVGETASGKTALALDLAEQFGGEIIAADSRTIYQGMDIVTAKPTLEERRRVPHHLLDVVRPDEDFSVSDFKALAEQAIREITDRGHIPFLVGGSGLYVDAVMYDFTFRPKADPALREELSSLSTEELQARIMDQGLTMPANSRNPRHLIRTLETAGEVHERKPLRDNSLLLGLSIDREVLRAKLAQRVEIMVEQGLVEEIKCVAETYGWEVPALATPGFKAFRQYLAGECTLETAKSLFVRNDFQLAKRQRTWFKRNPDIHWLCKKEEAVDLITTFLNN